MKKRSAKKKQRASERKGARESPVDPVRRAKLRRTLGVWAGVCAVAVGICLGGKRLEDQVHRLRRYDRPLVLRWVDLPDWLRLEENRHILDSLAQRADLRVSDRLLDRNLAERIGRALSEVDVGWISSVRRVMLHPDGVVSVRCQFRRPTAWVRHGRYCYLVDGQAVRLPGRYDPADCKGSRLMMIAGVQAPPPQVGHPWDGADLACGLRLVSLLGDKPFRHQITDIIVSNHGGRRDRLKPHIELATDHPGARILWGRPPDEEFGTEITAAQKITLLDTLYRQWGRIDMNRSYVNVMTWPDRVAMPVMKQTPKRRRLLRG